MRQNLIQNDNNFNRKRRLIVELESQFSANFSHIILLMNIIIIKL